MVSQPVGLKEMQDRLLKLEKQSRQFKRIGAASVIVLVSLVVMGQSSTSRSVTAQTVTAQEFVLKDSAGKMRANFYVEEKYGTGPIFKFIAPSGDQMLEITEGRIWMAGTERKETVISGSKTTVPTVLTDITPGDVSITKDDGRTEIDSRRIQITAGTLGQIQASRFAIQVQGLADKPTDEGSFATISPIGILAGDHEGFVTSIGQTKLQTTLTGETHQTSAASVVLFGKNGKVLWSTP